jgi:hypothetical protein
MSTSSASRPSATTPSGRYFSDGHDSGLYSWDLLYNLGAIGTQLWQAYLDRLQQQGASRDAPPRPRSLRQQGQAAANADLRDLFPTTDDERPKRRPTLAIGKSLKTRRHGTSPMCSTPSPSATT